MVSGNQRKGKEVTLVEDKFPQGMRVLVVDDNPVCLKVLEVLLRSCKYKPTMVMDASTTMKMLKEGGEEKIDLVITTVRMQNMDGFDFLEFINLEMDLPVIGNNTIFL
ncbi:two-component response regulator ORR25-like [Lolium perenne]|uniref:two-component response regulator ORR25-like n=1 Tax=Lolium perenne TaxID=4522 RepID=UPI003A99E9BB